jgi:hypothetical protein
VTAPLNRRLVLLLSFPPQETPRTTDDLTAALHACAVGLYPLEAAVALLASNDTFLHRDDFTSRFIQHGTSCGTPMAAIDWDTAITALQADELPCFSERRILNCQPASPPTPLSASVTPSPTSTTPTSADYSPPSDAQPEAATMPTYGYTSP